MLDERPLVPGNLHGRPNFNPTPSKVPTSVNPSDSCSAALAGFGAVIPPTASRAGLASSSSISLAVERLADALASGVLGDIHDVSQVVL